MISILLSCYKSNFHYLEEQIESIIDQTEKDWELLVYNDGTIGLKEFIKWYQDQVSNIKYFDEGHLGYTKAYDFLLKQAKGEYICFCDHDDIWEPDKLKIEKEYLDKWKDVDCVFGWLKWFGEKNKVEEFSLTDYEISKELHFYQPIKNPTVMFRKDRFGEFDSPFDQAADFWFWAKHKDRHYHLIEKVLVNYRRHAGEATKDKTAFRENSAKVIQESLAKRFGEEHRLHIDVCKMLDPYSKTHNPLLLSIMRTLV